MFWQNFQIPCVLPDMDFFCHFPCFPCAVGTLLKLVVTPPPPVPLLHGINLFFVGVKLDLPHPPPPPRFAVLSLLHVINDLYCFFQSDISIFRVEQGKKAVAEQ